MKKKFVAPNQCSHCGEEIHPRRVLCKQCAKAAQRIRRDSKMERLIGDGFKARRTPPGFQDRPDYFGED